MRFGLYFVLGMSLSLATGMDKARADSQPEPVESRISALVRQLGHDQYAKREAAARELESIGMPSVDALQKLPANENPEIRRRAELVLSAILGKVRAATVQRELARWQGDWVADEGQKMAIRGERWTSSSPGFGPISGTLKTVDVQDTMYLVDLLVEDGPTKGQRCEIILRLDGDTLHYCSTYDSTRPADFRAGGRNVYVLWKRVKEPTAAVSTP